VENLWKSCGNDVDKIKKKVTVTTSLVSLVSVWVTVTIFNFFNFFVKMIKNVNFFIFLFGILFVTRESYDAWKGI